MLRVYSGSCGWNGPRPPRWWGCHLVQVPGRVHLHQGSGESPAFQIVISSASWTYKTRICGVGHLCPIDARCSVSGCIHTDPLCSSVYRERTEVSAYIRMPIYLAMFHGAVSSQLAFRVSIPDTISVQGWKSDVQCSSHRILDKHQAAFEFCVCHLTVMFLSPDHFLATAPEFAQHYIFGPNCVKLDKGRILSRYVCRPLISQIG